MNEKTENRSQSALQKTLHEQLPQLGGEVELAFNALQKVRRITGALMEATPSAVTQADFSAATWGETADFDLASVSDQPPQPKSKTASSTPPQSQILTAGQTFGRYQISRQLGKGAMGAVYLAYDPQLQRYVALKTPFLSNKSSVVQRFYREARSAAQIRSPYVCPIYEVDSVGGRLYLTMAYIEGRPLTQWIHSDPRPSFDSVLEMFYAIASGVQKAHGCSVVHRDLKPDNIMVDADNQPTIMDFGLALRVDDEDRMTAFGTTAGTPAYMSPEQVRGNPDEIGPQADIYSLGIVLYEMLTGTLPFRGAIASVLHRIINEPPAPPSAVCGEIVANAPIERICLKMIAKKKSDRYASVTEVLADIAPLLRSQAAAVTPEALSIWAKVMGLAGGLFRKRRLRMIPNAG